MITDYKTSVIIDYYISCVSAQEEILYSEISCYLSFFIVGESVFPLLLLNVLSHVPEGEEGIVQLGFD